MISRIGGTVPKVYSKEYTFYCFGENFIFAKTTAETEIYNKFIRTEFRTHYLSNCSIL